MSCFKQLRLNSILMLELFIHTSFRGRLCFVVKGDLIISFDNPLAFHSEIVPGRPENVRVFLIGSNVEKFCDTSLPK